MTPISDLIAAIVARVLDKRRAPFPRIPAPVAEPPEDERLVAAWREPGE